ncbi:ubiquinol oxidase subunit II [Massilia sp. DWR3-1-1]|uniref:ubiquinol oxidase subunit II n=1 Tax=Massilia sp. DWR3-1-1 TaxID=2804559 RepID=UPI003CF0A598
MFISSIPKASSTKGLARRALLLLPLSLLSACNTIVMNPAGDIANQQADLIVVSTLLMSLIIVPVIALIIIFAWRYRRSNTSAPYKPEWDHSTRLELVIWGAPLLIIIALGLITWISTHLLDPYRPLHRLDAQRPIAANTKVLEVQVVALDWKWLFIYPELGIATVNELATPIDVPVRFKITASTVMNSFYIPAMAGQIYAMPSMQTTLNAVMNKPGVYDGFSANYSGAGFSNMRFKLHSMDQAGFDAWVAKVKSEASPLDRATYLALEKPTVKDAVRHFNSVETNLFDAVVNRCVEPGSICMSQQMHADAHRHPGATVEHQLAVASKAEICTTPTNPVKTN